MPPPPPPPPPAAPAAAPPPGGRGGVDVGGAASFDATLDELALLAESAGDAPVARLVARRKAIDAALYVGSGKADEIKSLVAAHGAEAVLFDQALSPVQQRNLERHLGVPVADRTALILEIFAARAQSHEGKLQVELARLQYLSTRLVRRWSHLERQRGGIGTRGGPGETQIELDRRMIGERIKSVKARLERVKRQRNTQRRAREKSGSFRVSLVGYTNAGKSTLFNALVKARAYAADQLFATLDTTTRQLYLEDVGSSRGNAGSSQVSLTPAGGGLGAARPWGHSVSLSDTVGFIRDLPHKLIEAFKATLQETAQADLLLHVVDASSPVLEEQLAEVERVLHEIGADRVPQILVYNKLDRLDAAQRPREPVDAIVDPNGGVTPRVFVSARDGTGLDRLRTLLARAVAGDPELNRPHGLDGVDNDGRDDALDSVAECEPSISSQVRP